MRFQLKLNNKLAESGEIICLMFFKVSCGNCSMNKKNQNGPFNLDKTDCGMINLLQKDERMNIVTLAKRLNISETNARSRLKSLMDNKVINIVAVSNPINLGFEIIGNLKLNIDLKKKGRSLRDQAG